MKSHITIIFILFLTPLAFSQGSQEEGQAGEIEEAEIVIEKERELILPSKDRRFAPSDLNPEIQAPIPLTFNILQPKITLAPYRPVFRSQSLDKPIDPILYNTEFILGFGNYISPLIQVSHQNFHNDWEYGLTVLHESFLNGPVRDDLSGAAESAVQAQLIKSFENFQFKSDLGFSRSGYYYYGYDEQAFQSNNDLFVFDRSHWQRIHVSSEASGSSKNEKLDFSIHPKVAFVSNAINGEGAIGQEFNLELPGSLSYSVDKSNTLGLDLGTSITRYNSDLSINRTWVSGTPWYKTNVGVLDFKLGLQVNMLTDSLEESYSQVGAIMTVGLPFFDTWRFEGGISNAIEENRLVDLYEQNYFLDDSLNLQYSVVKIPFWANVGGTILPNLRLTAGVKIEDIDNAQYFVPSVSDVARFETVYDRGELSIFKYYVEASYHLGQTINTNLSYAIYENSAGTQAEAWYRPKSTISFEVQSQFGKFSLGSSADIIQGLVGPEGIDLSPVELDDIIDINIDVDYRFSEQLAFFTRLENLTNQSNEYFLNYPTRKIAFKIGFRYRL